MVTGRLGGSFTSRRQGLAEILIPSGVSGKAVALLQNQGLELLYAQVVNQELDSGPGSILLFAQPGKHAGDGLCGGQQLLRAEEVIEKFSLVRNGPQPAANIQFKPAHVDAVLTASHGNGSQIVHAGQSTGVLAASAKGRFELSAEVLAVGMAQQESGQSPGIGSHIEGLVRADPRIGAGGDVANRIAASLSSGDSNRRQTAHQRRSILHVHVVELEILPGGDVGDTVGVFLGQFGHHLELSGVESAVGDLDSLHARSIPEGIGALGRIGRRIFQGSGRFSIVPLTIVVPLSINAPTQPGFREDPLIHLLLSPQIDLGVEDVDFPVQGLGNFARKPFFPKLVGSFHSADSLPVAVKDRASGSSRGTVLPGLFKGTIL